MKKIRTLTLLCMMLALSLSTLANEGMWIPSLLKKYNIEEMQAMGFKLTAEDVYDVNNNSMKDAVVLFGRGCTGEMVSNKGLLFTNHHCGYSQIQAHSSLENDYLTDGFWAKSQSEELVNPNLEVRYLDYMEDVSSSVFAGTEDLSETELSKKIANNIKAIKEERNHGGFIDVQVKPIFKGNQYFAYVYKVFKDVRLVGAPPSAIGKFGGDTDNWMWPRHTGDFAVFRVYANANNEPAEYAEDNKPYQPKAYFPISIGGVQPEDFVMVFGFPGSTDEYLPSYAVDLLMNQTDPARVDIRTVKLGIMKQFMNNDAEVRIKYAAKYASASNGWKKWQGEIKGLKRLNAVKVKQDFEAEFTDWLNSDKASKEKYQEVLPKLNEHYQAIAPLSNAYHYYLETWYYGAEIMSLAYKLQREIKNKDYKAMQAEDLSKLQAKLRTMVDAHFKDYDQDTDQAVFVALMRKLQADIDASYLPTSFASTMSKYNNQQLLSKVYNKSFLTQKDEVYKWIDELPKKANVKDSMFEFTNELTEEYNKISTVYGALNRKIKALEKQYMAGIMEMKKNQRLYPDANNLTMRIGYGKVENYKPADGVVYNHYTTLNGIIEKDNPEIYDYNVPQKLRNLYADKDYGRYALDNGSLPVAFIASVHTTGGNSGSPAINAEGQLIGINFDRCWEGTMSDIMFDADRCRNIMVDVRYVLFIIDKFAGASYLLEEMNIQ